MVGVGPSTDYSHLHGIQDWLVQYWIDNEPDPAYRIALSSLLNTLWPKTGRDGKPSYFPLPILCGNALGKVSDSTIAVNAAWILLFVASYLLDKIEDEETDHPLFSKYSPGVVANLTTGLILHSGRILADLEAGQVPNETLVEIRHEFHEQALAVCAGQHQDLTVQEPTFDQIWQTVNAKSGKFFALGAYLGARLASSNKERVTLLSEVGRRIGIINQINNDISGLGSGQDTGSDLAYGRRTLPVQYALKVMPPENCSLLVEYLNNASHEPSLEIECRKMILSAGALIYLSLEKAKHQQQAISLLEKLQSPPEHLTSLYNLINLNGLHVKK